MKRRRNVVALTGLVVAAGWVLLAIPAIGGSGRPHPPEVGRGGYVEPSIQPVPDGAYFGYVRALGTAGSSVAVDFVSVRDGVVDNARPEQLVDAGVLGEAGFFGSVARPFRVRLHNGVVVAVQSADEMIDGAPVR